MVKDRVPGTDADGLPRLHFTYQYFITDYASRAEQALAGETDRWEWIPATSPPYRLASPVGRWFGRWRWCLLWHGGVPVMKMFCCLTCCGLPTNWRQCDKIRRVYRELRKYERGEEHLEEMRFCAESRH